MTRKNICGIFTLCGLIKAAHKPLKHLMFKTERGFSIYPAKRAAAFSAVLALLGNSLAPLQSLAVEKKPLDQGVLAINTNQSAYVLGQGVHLQGCANGTNNFNQSSATIDGGHNGSCSGIINRSSGVLVAGGGPVRIEGNSGGGAQTTGGGQSGGGAAP